MLSRDLELLELQDLTPWSLELGTYGALGSKEDEGSIKVNSISIVRSFVLKFKSLVYNQLCILIVTLSLLSERTRTDNPLLSSTNTNPTPC